jgi:hypothetical protein
MPPKKGAKTAKSPKKKNNHLTEVLNAVTMKAPCDYNPKDVSAYVLSLFMSEDQGLRHIVNDINMCHFSTPDPLIFKYYVESVPKGFRRTKFTKKTKDAEDNKAKVEALMKEYGISQREAMQSLTKGLEL